MNRRVSLFVKVTGIFIAVTCIASLSLADVFFDKDHDIQIRIYADRGAKLPDGRKGGAVQVYGVNLQQDGSEKVVWKQFLFEFHGLLFNHRYEYLPLNSKKVYLYVPEKKIKFFALDRKVGKILKKAEENDPEFSKLKKEHSWYPMIIIDRPVTNNPQPQVGGVGQVLE